MAVFTEELREQLLNNSWLLVVLAAVPYFGRMVLSRFRVFHLLSCTTIDGTDVLEEPLILAGAASTKSDYGKKGVRNEGRTFETTLSSENVRLLCLAVYMPLTIVRLSKDHLDGKENAKLSEESIIKKGDVIEAINGIDLRMLRYSEAVDVITRELANSKGGKGGKNPVTLRILAARVYDNVYDGGSRGFTTFENYGGMEETPYGGMEETPPLTADDSPWSNFRTNARIAGWSNRLAYTVAAFRLICWHWLQPALYWAILILYWDQLKAGADNDLQLHLALAVGVREALYFPITLFALVVNPSFLLIDLTFDHSTVLSADALSGGVGAINTCVWSVYGFTPEKM